MGSSTGAPFSLAIPDDDDLATFVLDYLNPNLIALNSNAVHRTGDVVLSGGKRYTSSGLTLTSDTPILDAAVTFNAPGVVLNAAVVNVTDTASHANSTLLDLKVAGTSKASVRKDGLITTAAGIALPVGSAGSPSLAFDSGNGIYSAGTDRLNFATAGVVRAEIDAAGNLGVGVLGALPASHVNRPFLMAGSGAILAGDTGGDGLHLWENTYFDAALTNKALVAAPGVSVDLTAGTFSVSTAPSVAAGATQTFTPRLAIALSGALTLNTTVSGSASVGGVTPPASVQGYIAATINGVAVKIPYYAN